MDGGIGTRRRPKGTGLPSSPWLRRDKMARQACRRQNKKQTRNNGIGRRDDGVVRFKILLLTISGEYVKYDYHIMQGD